MQRMSVEQHGFYGIWHPIENQAETENAVIVIGGSEGNENIPLNVGRMFAECGIPALGICYFNVPGLPTELIRVPIDPFEKAISWLKDRGYKKIFMYGISKGAELVLLCASLMPDINGVIALSPSHCIWGGMKGNRGMLTKKFTNISEFTYQGKDFPCMMAELKYGPVIGHLITQQQFNFKYMYEKPLEHFDEKSTIPVENINGDILFIYAKEDLSWPSGDSVFYMMNRLKTKNWTHQMEEICYEKASHILIPLSTSMVKMFKIERKYPKECLKSRMDAFDKTIEWVKTR
jgi:hypothetical protein